MDTINSQIILDNHVIHPETKAAQVIYGNTNAKAMMDGVLSSANLSSAVQSLLNSNDYTEACRALKIAPETFFDECFNHWEAYGSPDIQNGSLILDGSSAITSANTFTLNDDFSLQMSFTTGDSVAVNQALTFIFVSSAIFFDVQTNTSSQLFAQVRIASNNTKTFANVSISANTKYFLEITYDKDSTTFYCFLNGSLIGSQVISYPGGNHQFSLSGNYAATPTPLFTGQVHEFRFSNCIRHISDHTATDSDYFSYDDNTISLLHFGG